MSDKTQLITSLDFAYDAIQHECYNDALSSILEAKEAAHQILDMGDKAQLDRINEILLSISDSDDTLGFHERNRLAHKILDICQPQWIPVAERLPDERCIAYTDNEDITIAYRFIPARMFKQIASEATHWKPLPPPPEDTA